jgi:hypothetical protein
MISISNKLRIVAKEWVTIPGCEPLSMVTSVNLLKCYGNGCKSAYAKLDKALAAIEGSYVERFNNGDLFFVLPDFKKYGCKNCKSPTDYYAILRSLAEDPGDDVKNIQFIDYGDIVNNIANEYRGICW